MASLNLTDAMDLLASGEMESLGLLPWGSNYTFLVKLTGGPLELFAVYKPRQGESPLWDFPEGTLCLREYAAWVVSDTLGWNLVPPTVLRTGTQGFGSVQLYIDNDPDQHYQRFRDRPELADQRVRLVDRHALGAAVDLGGRGDDHLGDAELPRRLDDVERA